MSSCRIATSSISAQRIECKTCFGSRQTSSMESGNKEKVCVNESFEQSCDRQLTERRLYRSSKTMSRRPCDALRGRQRECEAAMTLGGPQSNSLLLHGLHPPPEDSHSLFRSTPPFLFSLSCVVYVADVPDSKQTVWKRMWSRLDDGQTRCLIY